MNYITGPFYGRFDKYKELLEKLDLDSDDTLFILGNAIGYDKDSMKLLLELSYSPNVFLIMGKQEYLAKKLLPKLKEAGDVNESILSLGEEDRAEFLEWVRIGGYEIARSFFEMSPEDKEGVMDYLSELETFSELEANGKSFVLMHSAPTDFSDEKELEDYSERDFAFGSTDYSKKYFSSSFLITADKSTDSIKGGSFAKVYSGKNRHISLATLDPSQGRASALCLDNMKVIYGEYVDIDAQ